MGKLIVIEGVDSSGKETQTKKLYERLKYEGNNVIKVEYPNYNSKSSTLVKMYLNGEFGNKPEDVNSFAASTFYAVDRYASFVKEWKEFYENGGVIIADRYTTSNMLHQAYKIDNINEREKFIDWIWDLEFKKMGLPIPDEVIFLNMPPEVSRKLMKNRLNKITGETKKDIHESDDEHINKAYNDACWVANKYNWNEVKCSENNEPRKIDDIHEEIFNIVNNKL